MRLLTTSLLAAVATACGPVGSSGTSYNANGGGPPGGGQADGGGGGGGGPQDASTGPDATTPSVDSGGEPESGGAGTDQLAPGGYHVTGPTIYDSQNRPHMFHGVDRPSLEWNSNGENLSMSDYQLMASWKANVVRIALNQDFWLSGAAQYAPSYASAVDQQIQWAEMAGMDVILDLHWSDKGNLALKPSAQQRMADANSVTFWAQVAARYKGDGRVMFELYNEPHDVSWDVWLNGGPSGDGFMVAGMQQLYDTVRNTAQAENLVFIGGLQFAYDLSGVPTHRVQGHNIVWATHPYNQTGKQPSNWDAGFGFVASSDPVMATEYGDLMSCSTSYYSQFITYADAHKISWSGWAWYVSGCSFPSLITDWPTGTPSAAGQIEKTALLSY